MKRALLVLGIILISMNQVQAAIVDAPHNETNFVSCGLCHNYSLWWQSSPINDSPVREATVKAICLNCHDESGHASVDMGAAHRDGLGLWSTSCVDCHSVHTQGQLSWQGTVDYLQLYLVTGSLVPETLAVSGAGTLASPYHSTFQFQDINAQDGWTIAETNKWVAKTGETGRGLIMSIPATDPGNTFEVIEVNQENSLVTVNGRINSSLDSGAGFGLLYGQLIRDKIDTGAGLVDIKFFNPDNDFIDQEPAGSGLCQVCHTATKHFTSDGQVNNGSVEDDHNDHLADQCTLCHSHRGGFGRPLAEVDFSAASQNLGEDAGIVTVSVNLSEELAENVTVPYTVSGTAIGGGIDHNMVDGNITINAGQLAGITTFTITDDGLKEGDETVIVTMGSPDNALAGTVTVQTITITDNDTNAAPVASNDSYTTVKGTELNIPAPGILGNDSDVDNDPLTALVITTTSNGNLVLDSNTGAFTYVPVENFTGTDSFTYKANDGELDSNVVAVTITVLPSESEMFSMDAGMWLERHFDDPDDQNTYAHADMLKIVNDATYGKALAVGPFVSGEWSLRYDYNLIIDSPVLTVRGMYRTENLPAGVAALTVSYYNSLNFGDRVYKKVIPLGKSDTWTEFEVPLRIPYFDAVGMNIGFGVDAKSDGKAYFANLSYETSVQPLASKVDINLSRPKVSNFSAAGYVRVAESNDTWYFADPAGKPFFAMGAVLPTWNSGDSVAAQANFDLMTSGKFNAGGGWSSYWRWAEANNNDEIRNGREPIYIFNTMESLSSYPLLLNALNESTGDSDSHAFPDPFASALGDSIRSDVENSRYITEQSSWFVGFSPDNERSHADLWRYVYSPNTKPQFQSFLEGMFTTIEALNADWGTAFTSFDNLITSKPDPVAKSGPMFEAFQEFAREIVRKYCQVTSSAIREFDIEHLLISPQLMLSDYATWIDYLDIYGEYFDVIALNMYPENYEYGLGPDISAVLDEVHETTGKPIIITEWSVPAQDSGFYNVSSQLHSSYDQLVASQSERANQTIKYIEDAFNKPYVIGYYWFKWEDYSYANRGITRADSTMYDELWAAFTGVNSAITDYLAAEEGQ